MSFGGKFSASVKAVSLRSIPRPPPKSPISLTPNAVNRINEIYSLNSSYNSNTTKAPPNSYLKISVRTKGCSGNSYTLDWSTKSPLDEEVTIDSKHKLLIDSMALFTLLGSQMDYVQDKLSEGFVFNNPNIKETCGCGLSFIV